MDFWIRGRRRSSAIQLRVSDGTAHNVRSGAGTGNGLVAKIYSNQRIVASGSTSSGTGCLGPWYSAFVPGTAAQDGELPRCLSLASTIGWICSDGMEVIGTPPSDATAPSIAAFSVSPSTITLGQSFTINYTVSDAGGSQLNRVALRRTSGDGSNLDPGWQEIATKPVTGNGPVSGSFSDTPSAGGKYWYGMAVFDNAANSKNERQAGRGPIQVTVNATCQAAGLAATNQPAAGCDPPPTCSLGATPSNIIQGQECHPVLGPPRTLRAAPSTTASGR